MSPKVEDPRRSAAYLSMSKRSVPPSPPPQPPPDLPAGAAGSRRPPPSATTRRLRAESPADLLALIPYLLGYHPTESLVMAVVRDRTIALSVRIDLVGEPAATAARLAQISEDHRADGVLLIAYSRVGEHADRFLTPAIAALRTTGVIDALYADGQRWWSRLCSGDCCPSEGVPYEVASHRLAAEAVLAGMSALQDRTAIEGLVHGPPSEVTDELQDLAFGLVDEVFAAPLADRRAWTCGIVDDYVRRRLADEPVTLDDDQLVRLACQVVDVVVRDEVWVMLDRETAWAHVELWQRVVARAAPPLEAAPLCLLGMAAWVAGQGTLQVCCLERVREVHPDYTMADLLEDINARAVPPDFWQEVRGGMRDALQLQLEDTIIDPLPFSDLIDSPRSGIRLPRRHRRPGRGH